MTLFVFKEFRGIAEIVFYDVCKCGQLKVNVNKSNGVRKEME